MKKNLKKNIDNIVKILITNQDESVENNYFEAPDKNQIIKIIHQLQQIIFLEYFEKQADCLLMAQLQDVFNNLSKQISIVLRCLPKYQKIKNKSLISEGEKLSLKFLQKLPDIKQIIKTDLQASFDGDPAAFNKHEIVVAYPGLFAIMVNRLAHELYNLGVPILPRIMTEYAHTQTGIDIHPGATLGKYFFIDHGTGIVIGETAVIGNNVKIYQGVTIGALSTKGGRKLHGKKRHPTIEDNVIIYANASILGGETIIGKNSVIGGNAFITSSIPNNTKVSIKSQELDFR